MEKKTKGKDKTKFIVFIRGIDKLNTKSTGQISVGWTCGTKKGKLKGLKVSESWDDKIEIDLTTDKKKEKEKLLAFTVTQKGEKKKKIEIGKGSVNLSQFTSGVGPLLVEVPLGKGPILKVEVVAGEGGDDEDGPLDSSREKPLGALTPLTKETLTGDKTDKTKRHSLYHISPPKYGEASEEKSEHTEKPEKKPKDSARSNQKKKNRQSGVYQKEDDGKITERNGTEIPTAASSRNDLPTPLTGRQESFRDTSMSVRGRPSKGLPNSVSTKDMKVSKKKERKTPRKGTGGVGDDHSDISDPDDVKDLYIPKISLEDNKKNEEDIVAKLRKEVESLKIESEELKYKLAQKDSDNSKTRESSEKDIQEKDLEIKRLKLEANMRLQSHMTQSAEYAKFRQDSISQKEEISTLQNKLVELDETKRVAAEQREEIVLLRQKLEAALLAVERIKDQEETGVRLKAENVAEIEAIRLEYTEEIQVLQERLEQIQKLEGNKDGAFQVMKQQHAQARSELEESRKSLAKALKELEETRVTKDATTKDLTDRLRLVEEKLANVKKEAEEELANVRTQAENDLEETKKDFKKIELELDATKKDLKKKESELDTTKKDLKKKESELAETIQKWKNQESSLKEKEGKIKDLGDQLQAALTNVGDTQAKNEQFLKIKIQEKENQLKSLSQQLEEALSNSEMYLIDLDKIREEFKELEVENKKKETILREKESEIDAKNFQLKEKDVQLKKMREQLEEMTNIVEKIRTEKREKEEFQNMEFTEKLSQIEILKAQLKEKDAQIKKIRGEMEKSEEAEENRQAELNKLRLALEELVSEHNKLQHEYNLAQKTAATLDAEKTSQILDLQKRLDSATKSLGELQTQKTSEIKELRRKLSSANKAVEEAKGQRGLEGEELQKRLDDAQEAAEDWRHRYEREVEALQGEAETARGEAEEARRRLEEERREFREKAEKTAAEAEQARVRAEEEKKDLRKKLERVTAEAEEVRSRVMVDMKELQRQLEAAKETIEEMEETEKRKNSEIREIQKKLEARTMEYTIGQGVEVRELQKKLEAANATIEELKGADSERRDLQKKLDKTTKIAEEAQKKLESSSKAIAGLTNLGSSESKELQKKLDNTISTLETIKKQHSLEILDLKQKLEKATTQSGTESKDLLKKLEISQKTIEELKEKNKDLQKQLNKDHQTVEELTERIRELSERSGGGGGDMGAVVEQMNVELELLESTLYFMSSSTSPKQTTVLSEEDDGFIDERVVTLYRTLVSGSYFEKDADYGFLGKVIDVMRQSYQRSANEIGEVIFWLKQISYLTDLFAKEEKPTGKLIKREGVDVLAVAMDDGDNRERFRCDLSVVVLDIYKLLLALAYEDLGKLLIDVAYQPIDDKGNPQGLLDPRSASILSAAKSRSHGIRSTTMAAPSPKKGTPIPLAPSDIVRFFSYLLSLTEKHTLPDAQVLQFFNQVYHFSDCTLFNEIIQNAVKHSIAERGFYLKLVASVLEEWSAIHLGKRAKALAGKDPVVATALSGIGRLPHIVQTANVLVLDKYLFTDEVLVKELFPSLSMTQLLRILSKFQPSKVAPNPVPKAVLKHVEGMGADMDNPTDFKLQIVLLGLPKKK